MGQCRCRVRGCAGGGSRRRRGELAGQSLLRWRTKHARKETMQYAYIPVAKVLVLSWVTSVQCIALLWPIHRATRSSVTKQHHTTWLVGACFCVPEQRWQHGGASWAG